MITLPAKLDAFMKGQDLKGLRPYALLYRNKWVDESGSGDTPHYELDTANPIDITDMIAKPNTLSMTLDVNEIAQYNCNNVTLTLADTQNKFVENTPNSYFPDGYQLYGSKVVLYYGIDDPHKNYIIQNGKLVWASPDVYIKNIGTSYVDTGFIPSKYTRVTTHFKIDDIRAVASGTRNCILGANAVYNQMKNFYACIWQQTATSARAWFNTTNTGAATGKTYVWEIGEKYYLDLKGTEAVSGDLYSNVYDSEGTNIWHIQNSTSGDIDMNNKSLTLFQRKYYITDPSSYFLGALYQTQVYEQGVLVRDLVPVPSGLVIGDFVVPENGMFDIVTQTFYGNSGNGAFTYGDDRPADPPQRTALFTGMIKDLPTYKPEKYQLDLKLVSPLEMLKDIEAKEFSNKVTGETLTYKSTDSDGHKIYWTSGTGVGGFSAVYANGTKLFEGVDYEVTQTSALGLPAIVTIINSAYYSSAITADYYTWKTGLTVEQIVAGLVGLAGYDSGNEDIRNVTWSTAVKNQVTPTVDATIGYKQNGAGNLVYTGGGNAFYTKSGTSDTKRFNLFPNNFEIQVQFYSSGKSSDIAFYEIGDVRAAGNSGYVIDNGVSIMVYPSGYLYLSFYENGSATGSAQTLASNFKATITKVGNLWQVKGNQGTYSKTLNANLNGNFNEIYSKTYNASSSMRFGMASYVLSGLDNNNNVLYSLSAASVMFSQTEMPVGGTGWGGMNFTLSNANSVYALAFRTEENGNISSWQNITMGATTGESAQYIRFYLRITTPNDTTDLTNIFITYLASSLTLMIVNLTGLTVLEALQDFALISGYEFGVDRNGVFFFRPRIASTTPVYTLDHNELVKVDTVKKNFSDFFTKLTLTFAQVPLEFYANEGTRPTAVDKYGVINKEIDKPEIVNYDNPELAQAIGPQLLAAYASFPDVIQCVGKMNLALELADIVLLERNYNLITPADASEYDKYSKQQTYYRACKITGLNYNFSKNQITYTLRDVSNADNTPQYGDDMYEFVYDLPIQLGAK